MENANTNDEGILHNRSENRAENSTVVETRPSAFGGSSEVRLWCIFDGFQFCGIHLTFICAE